MSEPDQPETPPPPQPEAPTPPPPPQYGAYPGAYPGSYPPPPGQYAGYPPPQAGPPPQSGPPPQAGPQNGLGIAALVVAIIALISVFGGVVLGIVAVVLGFLGWNKARRGEANNGGVAVAGIVLGFLSIIEAIVVIGFAVWGFNEAGGGDYVECLSKAGSDQQAMQQCIDQFTDTVENQFSITMTTPTPP
jgi:hypothetical protein